MAARNVAAADRVRVSEIKSLMTEIDSLFKLLKNHAGSKTASKKAMKAASKESKKAFKGKTQKDLISEYELAIEAVEMRLRLPLSLINYDFRTVIPEPLDKRFDNNDYKIRLKALHDRYVQWMKVMDDRNAPWCRQCRRLSR